MYIIGTDEAGYGPNLGPLVITATVWESPADDLSFLFEPLKHAGITVADSKKLYHGSLSALEKNVSAVLDSQSTKAAAFANVLSRYHVRLLDVRSRIIEPAEFNRLLNALGSKGTLLSNATMQLAAAVSAGLHGCPRHFFCDKHGGRNKYMDLLLEHFSGCLVQVLQESTPQSEYRFYYGNDEITFRFIAKGESHLPVALASMVSKYRRELAMQEFNRFWQAQVPGLRPTAGYPEDAKRFIQDIAADKVKLGIADETFWRKK
jgi:ribonuclease HII